MNRAIEAMWWIGLIGALVATLAILKAVSLVLRALIDIHQLSELTHEAAEGVATNLAVVSKLSDLEEPAGELRQSVAALASAVTTLGQKLDGLVTGLPGRGG